MGVRNAILRKLGSNFTPTERGPLFEQWIYLQVKALIDYEKKDWRISSYRDDRGLEVDLVIETGKELLLVEIKYQSKFRTEFESSLTEFASSLARGLKAERIIVYTGDRELLLDSGSRVLPYQEFLSELRSR